MYLCIQSTVMILFHQQMEPWDITLILEREQLLPSHVMMDSGPQVSLLPLVLTLDCGFHHHNYITAHWFKVSGNDNSKHSHMHNYCSNCPSHPWPTGCVQKWHWMPRRCHTVSMYHPIQQWIFASNMACDTPWTHAPKHHLWQHLHSQWCGLFEWLYPYCYHKLHNWWVHRIHLGTDGAGQHFYEPDYVRVLY